MTRTSLSTAFLLFSLAFSQNDGFQPINAIAATVNGEVITQSEIRLAAGPIIRQLSERYPKRGPEFQRQADKVLEQVMDEMIDRELILEQFRELGGQIPSQIIKEEVQNQIDQLYGGDEKAFLEELRRAGMSRKNFEESQREKLIVGSLKQERYSTVGTITPAEIAETFEQEKAQFRDPSKDSGDFYKIFLPPGKTQNEFELNLAKANRLVDELKANKIDFSETAKILSIDTYAKEGGKWFDVNRQDINEEFAAVIFDAKEGDILGPIPSNFGFTIIKVHKLRFVLPEKMTPLMASQIENKLHAEKKLAVYESWIKRLRNDALIKNY